MMVFSRNVDLNGAVSPNDAISRLRQHMDYMQEAIEQESTRKDRKIAALEERIRTLEGTVSEDGN